MVRRGLDLLQGLGVTLLLQCVAGLRIAEPDRDDQDHAGGEYHSQRQGLTERSRGARLFVFVTAEFRILVHRCKQSAFSAGLSMPGL